MKKYHILFKLDLNNFFSNGKDYQAENIIQAIELFIKEFPNAIILNVASEEMFDCRFLTK